MLEKVFHFLTGYARLEVRGDWARFWNMAAKGGFSLWGFAKEEGTAEVSCRARDYKKLRPLAHRCGVKLRCRKKGGVPFPLWRFWKRKGLVAGVACGAGLFFFLSGFTWGVTVSGTTSIGDRVVLDAAGKAGVYVGASKDKMDPKLAARDILVQMPELKWATVNTDGCFAEIVVGEAEAKPEIADDTVWSNMVASRAGIVRSIQAERGRPEVSLGDTVEEGDLLIAGLFREQLDPWDPRADQPMEAAGAARGSVVAETYREFTVQVSAAKRETVPTGKRQVNSALSVFGLRVPLGLNTIPTEPCIAYQQLFQVTALDMVLPISLERRVYDFCEERERILSEEELKDAALLKLRQAQKSEIAPGGKVVKEELSYAFPQGMCVLTAKCRVEEEIGEIRKIEIAGEDLEEMTKE